MSATIFRSQLSPMNEQLLKYYLSEGDFEGATNQYLSGITNYVARNRLPLISESLRTIYSSMPHAPAEWSDIDKATHLIYNATKEDPKRHVEARDLLKGSESDLGKAMYAYCILKIDKSEP